MKIPDDLTPIETEWINEHLQKSEFLNCLDPKQTFSLIRHLLPRLYKGNQWIIREGEKDHPFFFIYSGRVSVSVERHRKRSKLATLKRGDFFGEIALLTGNPATADVLALSPTKAFFLNSEHFIELVRGSQKLAAHIAEVMKKRLEERDKTVETLKNMSNEEINDAIRDFLGVKESEGTPNQAGEPPADC